MAEIKNLAGILAGCVLGVQIACAKTSGGDRPLLFRLEEGKQKGAETLEVPMAFPGYTEVSLLATAATWDDVGELHFDVAWPEDGATNAQIMLYLVDWDHLWYQNLLPGYLQTGSTNRFKVDLSPTSAAWSPRGHHASWHLRALRKPKQFGIRVFGSESYQGTFSLLNGKALPRPVPDKPPTIQFVRANANRLPCYGKFELTCELPDRYRNPFDPDQVSLQAEFTQPDGNVVTVDGFYARNYYRLVQPTGERFVPQGPALWQIRFAPMMVGDYTYTIIARDRCGETRWGPASFVSTAPQSPGFVRVSKKDPRFFEFTDGTPFYPIGHNTRSPYDARMNKQFPWVQRWPEGTSVYERYFRDMHRHGENLAEVWTAAWSLGLEWSETLPGYYGIGEYNLRHAWELDRIIDLARDNGIYVNIVIHNHGKFSTYWDPEWAHNPHNAACGGYLKAPEEYLTDRRAKQSFIRLMRYMIARWGYSPHVFAWQLWSELDLVGTQDGFLTLETAFYGKQEAVDWHREIGAALKAIDPYDHMLSTHVCNDYSRQNPKIVALPEMDLSCVDAYYHTSNPLDIIGLVTKTAAYNNAFKKPVLITEFGGSPHAAAVRELDQCLHAGLWSSVGNALGGPPMFWWWQLVEEENYYERFAALRRFMEGEDRRDPAMLAYAPKVEFEDKATTPTAAPVARLGATCLKSTVRAVGWVYDRKGFRRYDLPGDKTINGAKLHLTGMDEGLFRIEFWDTAAGRLTATEHVDSEAGTLSVQLPAFVRDIAFKARPHS